MNKGLLAVLMMAVMAAPAMAGSIGNLNYHDHYNIAGWYFEETINDNNVNINADTLQGNTADDFYDYTDDEVAAEASIRADADNHLDTRISNEKTTRIARDIQVLNDAKDYTDDLQDDLENGNIIVEHAEYADNSGSSWYSMFSGYANTAGYAYTSGFSWWSNYANQAGNADTLDGWDASDLRRYTRQRVRAEEQRAEGVEEDLQNQIDALDVENTAAHNSMGSSINNGFQQIAELRGDVTELQGVVFEYETDKNFNDFVEKCGTFSKTRFSNEADVLNYDTTYKTTANSRTRNALENAVGMINGANENSGLTKQICFDQIPSAFSGYDYNGDGNIAKDEGNIWCVVYPAFQSEREKYPCPVEQVFESPFVENEQFVIYKEETGEPKLLHITPEDYAAIAMKAIMNGNRTATTPLTKEQSKCLSTVGRWNC